MTVRDATLLIVDDEPGIRKVLAVSLADLGYQVHTAESGEQALAIFRSERPGIVLTDIKMPGMDGLALLAELKSLDPDVEVVMLTGHGDIDLAIQSIQRDATDFVTKPISDDALKIALRRARERLELRRKVRDYTENLERLVREKTRELVAAERLAAVGQTIAGLSHAIKNIASGLEGGVFLVGQGRDKDNREYLDQGWEMLKTNVARIKDLSLAMLDFAKPVALAPVPCDPALPARQVAELLAPRAAGAGVALRLDLPPVALAARLDPEAVHGCLLNLVVNAIEACQAAGSAAETPTGQVAVTLRRLGDEVEYEVADNGLGLDEEQRQRLFTEIFSTKGAAGSGFGLMGTRKLVQEMGGTIRAEGSPGAGARFYIRLPLEPGAASGFGGPAP